MKRTITIAALAVLATISAGTRAFTASSAATLPDTPASLAATPLEEALALYKRLTGTPLNPSDARATQMASLLQSGRRIEAAAVATADANFFNITLRNWASVMSNREETPYVPLNDFQATVIGAARDDLDARTLLTGNYIYQGNSTALPAVAPDNNNHYAQIDTRNLSLKDVLVKREPQRTEFAEFAGLLTTRGWGEAHLIAGTNRRAIEYTLREFMCATKEQWKDLGVPDQYVRRDVTRTPGDNPQDYQNRCRSCHGIMDAFGGTFSRYDFVANRVTFMGPNGVAAKLNQHADVYPEGWVVQDDYWVNFAVRNHNAGLGWRGPLEGRGLPAFARMVSESAGFSRCMARRVFHDVCRREPAGADEQLIVAASQRFESNGYKIKRLFEDVATQPSCLSTALGAADVSLADVPPVLPPREDPHADMEVRQ